MIAGVVLAAGSSVRFGAAKLLHPLSGEPLICHALRVAAASLPQTIIVTGSEEIRSVVDRYFPSAVSIVDNPDPGRGQLSSLKCALESLSERCDAAMVFLADMPYITGDIVGDLAQRFEATGRFVVPVCDGDWRHPRVIPHRYFPEFLELDDDERGTRVFKRHRDALELVEFTDSALFCDIDRPTDINGSA